MNMIVMIATENRIARLRNTARLTTVALHSQGSMAN